MKNNATKFIGLSLAVMMMTSCSKEELETISLDQSLQIQSIISPTSQIQTESIVLGEEVFEGKTVSNANKETACASCHTKSEFTSGGKYPTEIHLHNAIKNTTHSKVQLTSEEIRVLSAFLSAN
jgi:cytochrome c peroxidase